ncbi:glucose PTS transporter subunit IIA [Clostridium estertheticum]|nr:glucose PTS transporter subunit IIA [Clostridium estertheticum]
MVGYQGQVLPILIAVWVMGYIERSLRKIVPDILDILLTPFLTILITGFFTFFIIGPVGRFLGDGLSVGLVTIYNTAGVFAGILFGGFYSFIVITGIHQSFQAVEAGLLANPSIHRDFLLPIWSMANVAQGGAAFAVYFITKNAKMKSIAGPASLSAVLGITEPAIFGVNLRYRRPFIAAAIGGAIGGGYVVFTKVVMTGMGVSGIPGTTIVPPSSILNYIIGMVIAFATAFVVTSVLGIKEKEEEIDKDNNDENNEDILLCNEEKANTVSNLVSPVNGNVILLKDVPDKTFSDELLGKGIGVDPEDGIVVSPVDGTVVCLFETKHAIAIKTSDGMEILIHIGIDTVKMNGEGFKSFINSGDTIKKGQKLMEFDLDLVKEKAKSPIVLLVITNSDSMKFVNQLKSGKIKQGEELMRVGIN